MAARKPSHVRRHEKLIREQTAQLIAVFSEVSAERRVALESDCVVIPTSSRGYGNGGRQFREANGNLQRTNAPPRDLKAAIERKAGLRPLMGYVTVFRKGKPHRILVEETQLRALGTRTSEHGVNPATLTHRERRLLKQVERFDETVFNGDKLYEKGKFPEDM